MQANAPSGQESSDHSPSIAHAVCHDCDDFEKTYETRRPEDAVEAAAADAIEHGRLTGHDVEDKLVDEPASMTTMKEVGTNERR